VHVHCVRARDRQPSGRDGGRTPINREATRCRGRAGGIPGRSREAKGFLLHTQEGSQGGKRASFYTPGRDLREAKGPPFTHPEGVPRRQKGLFYTPRGVSGRQRASFTHPERFPGGKRVSFTHPGRSPGGKRTSFTHPGRISGGKRGQFSLLLSLSLTRFTVGQFSRFPD